MRKLESMITEFVGDLLRTIGEANIDELRELFASAPQGGSAFKIAREPVSLTLPGMPSSPAPPGRAVQGEGRGRGATPRRAFLPLSSLPPISSPPPGVAEITDPESLLSLVGLGANGVAFPHSPNAARSESAGQTFGEPRRTSRPRAQALLEVSESATPTLAPIDHDGDSPASGVRALGAGHTIKLSDNETLARVSNSGVVIRRKKRA